MWRNFVREPASKIHKQAPGTRKQPHCRRTRQCQERTPPRRSQPAQPQGSRATPPPRATMMDERLIQYESPTNNIPAAITHHTPSGDEGNLKWQIKNQTFWVALSPKKTWSVISKLFPLNCIFHYIGSWSKVLELYLKSFFNMKSWTVKIIDFLGDQEWVMDFDTFLRCFTSSTHSWYTSNLKSEICQ